MAEQKYPEFIWHNGAIKPWAHATTHVMPHALHYGSSVFEGIRSYPTPKGQAIFRLGDHLKRLFNSAKIYDMPMPYSLEQLSTACRDVIKANKLDRAYLRPVAFRGLGGFGLSADTPTDVAVAAWNMGPYLGAGVLEAGIDACVSSWQRLRRTRFRRAPKRAEFICRVSSSRVKHDVSDSEKALRSHRRDCSAKARVKTCSWFSKARCTRRRLARRCSTALRATRSFGWRAMQESK